MRLLRIAAVAAASVVGGAVPAGGDGTETLGPPASPSTKGSGIAVGGAGLFDGQATFTVNVPGDATVQQVLVYTEAGHRSPQVPDADIVVNGVTVDMTLIGGPAYFWGDVYTTTHRADSTDLALVGPGTTTLTVEGLDQAYPDGVGVVVIYQRPT